MAELQITSANAVYASTVIGLFPAPQALEGYGADAAFTTENVAFAEIVMGVDGHMSAGFVFAAYRQTITPMPDSPSIALFEGWHSAQIAAEEVFFASAVITLKSVNRTYIGTKGVLTGYTPVPTAARMLTARTFGITWQSMLPQPIG